VTDFLPWRFARPLGVTRFVPLSTRRGSLDRLVNRRKLLGQQLQNQQEASPLQPLTPFSHRRCSLIRPYPIAQGVKT